MPLADFFDQTEEGQPVESEYIKGEEKPEPKVNYEDVLEHVSRIIANRYPVSEVEKEKFVENFTFFGALLLTIVGFDDLERVLKVLKPLPPFAKLGIIIGGFVLIFVLTKPKVPKQKVLKAPVKSVVQEKEKTEPVQSPKPTTSQKPSKERLLHNVQEPNYPVTAQQVKEG